jgi:hypothetical protein
VSSWSVVAQRNHIAINEEDSSRGPIVKFASDTNVLAVEWASIRYRVDKIDHRYVVRDSLRSQVQSPQSNEARAQGESPEPT